MYKAWLIYNTSLQSSNFIEINNLYKLAGEKFNVHFEMVKNTDLIFSIIDGKCKLKHNFFDPDFILFLDKDIRLAKHLELLGYKLFNSSETIELCDDKIVTTQKLSNIDIKLPKTIFSHMFFNDSNLQNDIFFDYIKSELGFPLVVKEAFGSFGEQVYLIKNINQLKNINKQLWSKPHLYQEFIKSSVGRDVRLYVVGDRVVASMLRENDDDFRANVTIGGKVSPYTPSEDFINTAVKASKALGATFSGVDILFGENNKPILCEVNSNSHIKGIFETTGLNIANYILKEILEEISKYNT